MKEENYGSSPVKDAYIRLEIKAPEGCTFRECDICKTPYCFDGRLKNCLWCEINKEGPLVHDEVEQV